MPPASVTEIKYADYYQRGVVDGAYDQWMKFTFQAGVFEQIVKKNGYQKAEERFKVPGHDKLNWWPADNHGGYVREGNDGASYSAQLWHDEKTGFVYWHQSWAD